MKKKILIFGSGNQARVEFDSPERSVTPGQAAVFYQDDILLGGARIDNLP